MEIIWNRPFLNWSKNLKLLIDQFVRKITSLWKVLFLQVVREHDYTQQDSTTYLVGTNINRQSYKYTSKTTEEYQKAQEKWLKEKEESNKKAQEELANHVK